MDLEVEYNIESGHSLRRLGLGACLAIIGGRPEAALLKAPGTRTEALAKLQSLARIVGALMGERPLYMFGVFDVAYENRMMVRGRKAQDTLVRHTRYGALRIEDRDVLVSCWDHHALGEFGYIIPRGDLSEERLRAELRVMEKISLRASEEFLRPQGEAIETDLFRLFDAHDRVCLYVHCVDPGITDVRSLVEAALGPGGSETVG